MKELIPKIHPTEIKKVDFKDERLAKATQRITAIYNDAIKYADSKNKEIAKILADIADKKAYEADGYKSVDDYANKIFGINRQNAYALARAGRVYNDVNAHPELKKMSPSKVAELTTVSIETLQKDLDDKKITAETTQKELREYVKQKKVSESESKENPVVLNMYKASTVGYHKISETIKELCPISIPEWEITISTYFSNIDENCKIEIIKLPNRAPHSNPEGRKTIIRKLYIINTFESQAFVIEYEKIPKDSKEAASRHNNSINKEEIVKMMGEDN